MAQQISVDSGFLAYYNSPVANFCRPRVGQHVRDGRNTMRFAQCTELANKALMATGYKSLYDYRGDGGNIDYWWGTAINVASARSGDIIQMNSIVWTYGYTTQYRGTDRKFPHHTAVVDCVTNDGLWIFEQNVPEGGPVIRTLFPYRKIHGGRYWVYRAVHK